MRQQSNTTQEKELLDLIAAAKDMRRRELARLSRNVLHLPQSLLRRLANKPESALKDNTASTHAM